MVLDINLFSIGIHQQKKGLLQTAPSKVHWHKKSEKVRTFRSKTVSESKKKGNDQELLQLNPPILKTIKGNNHTHDMFEVHNWHAP